MKKTTIQISEYVKKRLKEVGTKGETYEEIIIKLLSQFNERRFKNK